MEPYKAYSMITQTKYWCIFLTNFSTMISLFSKNGTVYEQASRSSIEKRVIYILKNLVNKSTALEFTIVAITQILTIVSNDY